MRPFVLAAALSTGMILVGSDGGPSRALAQALGGGPIAPGSGFANGPPPAVSGGALAPPGSGLSSRAGTLDATPPVIMPPIPGQERDGLIARQGVVAGANRHPGRRARSRDGYSPSYPGVPDIIAPAD